MEPHLPLDFFNQFILMDLTCVNKYEWYTTYNILCHMGIECHYGHFLDDTSYE